MKTTEPTPKPVESTTTPANNAPDDPQRLQELRQRLVQLLIARAQSQTDNGSSAVPSVQALADSEVAAKAEPLTTDTSGPSAPTIHSSPNPSALLSDLRDVINRYVILPDMAAETLALWVVHTYAFALRQVTTYIGVVSPEKRCGKTTLLELLALLANRSLTAANISPAALFKVIQETSPTLLIDEADTFLQGRDELAGILNAGYRKANSYVVRVADGKPRTKNKRPVGPVPSPGVGEWTNQRLDGSPGAVEFARYSCWCPKVMAAIGRLPDTLADRCILITMQRKMPGEKCERLRQLNPADYRQRCADFVRQHSDAIAAAQPEIPTSLNEEQKRLLKELDSVAMRLRWILPKEPKVNNLCEERWSLIRIAKDHIHHLEIASVP